MLFFGVKNLWFRLGIALLLTLAAAFFVWKMYENFYVVDPYNPDLIGTAAYGHNAADAFKTLATITLVELGILLAVLIPYSFSRLYFVRVLILQMLFVGWFLLMAVASMHSGNVVAIHLVWLLVVNGLLFVLLVLSVIAEITGRKKLSQNANF